MDKRNILSLSRLNRNYLFDSRKLRLILEAAGNKDAWLKQADSDRTPVNEHA